MDHGGEALICLVGSHRDALEFFELTEEIFDQMPPFIHPVRAIHSTASTKSRLSRPLRPGSLALPRQSGSIFAHWASVNMNRSIQSLNHDKPKMGIWRVM
jgi:hypothetical protein